MSNVISNAASQSPAKPIVSPLDLPLVDESSDGPVWRRIHRALRGPIADGRWPRGAKLPIEAEMAAHFKVNRHTLRRAVSMLVHDGLLISTQGRGTFVALSTKLVVPVDGSGTPTDALSRAGAVARARLLRETTLEAGERLGGLLGLEPHRTVLKVEMVVLAYDHPVALCTMCLSHDRFSRFTDTLRGLELIDASLRSFGVMQLHSPSTTVTIGQADERESALLKTKPLAGIVVCEAQGVDQSGVPCALICTAWLSQRVELNVVHPSPA